MTLLLQVFIENGLLAAARLVNIRGYHCRLVNFLFIAGAAGVDCTSSSASYRMHLPVAQWLLEHFNLRWIVVMLIRIIALVMVITTGSLLTVFIVKEHLRLIARIGGGVPTRLEMTVLVLSWVWVWSHIISFARCCSRCVKRRTSQSMRVIHHMMSLVVLVLLGSDTVPWCILSDGCDVARLGLFVLTDGIGSD